MILPLRLFNVLHVCLDISLMELEDVHSDLYLVSYCFNLFIYHFFNWIQHISILLIEAGTLSFEHMKHYIACKYHSI